jgi:hypothetical protein
VTNFDEFAGAPLVVGSVLGVRAWEVDQLGRLTGVVHRKVWTPGENLSTCSRVKATQECLAGHCEKSHDDPYEVVYGPYGQVTQQRGSTHCIEPYPCSGAEPKCACGFWAYYRTADTNCDSGIRGIIEGYGPTTVGTKGFRATKAKILALSLPKYTLANGDLLGRVRHNYPQVEFFERHKDMLAQYPLVEPETPTPENDPEFWTRPVGTGYAPTPLWVQSVKIKGITISQS